MNPIDTLLESLLFAESQAEPITALDASNQLPMLYTPTNAGSFLTINDWLTGSFPAASGPADQYTRIPNADNMPYLYQGNTNGCGYH